MEPYLYRFRSIQSLLGEYQELKNQSIYFASRSELNDPMEGYKDIYWDGDEVVWRNFFRHYIQCLAHATFQFCVALETTLITWDSIPLHDPRHDGVNEKIRALLDEILAETFSHEDLFRYIKCIAERGLSVRRNEVEFHIRNVHAMAVPCINRVLHKHKLASAFTDVEVAIGHAIQRLVEASDAVRLLETSKAKNGLRDKEHTNEQIYAVINSSIMQMTLIDQHNGQMDRAQKNRNFVLIDFPAGYVQKIECLVYPLWYAACFTKNCKNSAVWGTYGDSHRGVCLKFKANVEQGQSILRLSRVCGWSSSEGPVRQRVSDRFTAVEYRSNFVSIDFFRSLGRLPIAIINRNWHTSEDGARSVCALTGDFTAEQHAKFWQQFEQSATTKLSDWAYEEEYRLIVHGLLGDYEEPALRVANYDFSDLEGIIFGMNTKEDDKLSIMRIIEEKCREHQRNDFKFYQAYYAAEKACIEVAELGLLKVSLDQEHPADVN
ncbi:DUF2971 domain-containing protein [Rhodanobacter sp. T12-5]|uniref:DUF2971 domain-containing protein n=1 Tax=Rhodanobacter sp. T12-5 TaxID=2024611 RepID=UPI0011ED53D2|nr:DUF2971 domain-containing protein [Rhodanobacter sp. T12-5]KAA0070788.1 DUF2971 domain-containing protein [Rhodanobacter sp. T12-5]